METKRILLTVVILFVAGGFALAGEHGMTGTLGLAESRQGELSSAIDVTYLSRNIWRGFDLYRKNHSAIQPSIDLDLFGTGLGVNVLYSRANRSGFENSAWLPVTLYYKNSLLCESFSTNYKIGWVYYNFPNTSGRNADLQEAFATISMPKLLPCNFVPHYSLIYMWPSRGGAKYVSDFAGWMHIFGLSYDWVMPAVAPETAEQIIHLSADLTYNDGLGNSTFREGVVGGKPVDHDWSHAVFGITTDFSIAKNLTVTPGIYHQLSMDDSVNPSDETWGRVSLTCRF